MPRHSVRSRRRGQAESRLASLASPLKIFSQLCFLLKGVTYDPTSIAERAAFVRLRELPDHSQFKRKTHPYVAARLIKLVDEKPRHDVIGCVMLTP